MATIMEIEQQSFHGIDCLNEKAIENFLNNPDCVTITNEHAYGIYNKRTHCICKIATEKDYRRQGYATEILKQFISMNDNCWLLVREGNSAARSLYEKLGFKYDSEKPNCFGDENGLIMVR